MAFLLLRRVTFSKSITNSRLSSYISKFSTSRASSFFGHDMGHSVNDRLHLSPLFSEIDKDDMKDCKIEVVDDATWHVSSGLIEAWRGNDNEDKRLKLCSDRNFDGDDDDEVVISNKDDPDYDEIEDMRVRGNLFYKLDKGSKEYEEYKFDFHGKKRNPKESKENKKKEIPTPRKIKKTNKESERGLSLGPDKKNHRVNKIEDLCVEKKQRSLTFNQLTAPYHEPFCLDIYVSKGSIRACIVHRATSNVVAVSHSISKDMKFDLGSTKNRSACGTVGKVLAQKALADDIHNVVYTPRKGDKLEGKLKIVLEAVVEGGVDVKVKLKQRKTRQGRGCYLGTQHRR
ncbi:hypothetical protein CASFOL_012830 [Castilleja foliolosa]|uniref:Ribosomal protein L18 n=1 Tax=Castilleja foliolosa TaxID=1961234 RepID=A0ABD3DI74_9LAMI